jgi:hypothetical protein
MREKKHVVLIVMSSAMLIAILLGMFTVFRQGAINSVHAAAPSTYLTLTRLGNSSFASSGLGSASGNNDTTADIAPDVGGDYHVHSNNSASIKPTNSVPTVIPNPNGRRVTTSNQNFTGFPGLTHLDQRLAGTGIYTNTQFSLEPPDQGLCVGRGYVVEPINNALAIYNASSHALVAGPTPLSAFFGLAPEIDRTTGITGPFISDPRCYFDPQTRHWFLTELMLDNGTNTGATGRNFNLVAVSQTNDPTGTWTIFKFDVTDDGLNGTPSHANCPCFGDQPLIGADRYGFYVSTNEFNNPGTAFNGAQLYAISKGGLIKAATGSPTPPVVTINTGAIPTPDVGGIWYSIQPATSPKGDISWQENTADGTEYFLSALQFGPAPLDNRIAAWALTNTQSLNQKNPNVNLSFSVLGTRTYGQPLPAVQKPGPIPLGTSVGEPLEQLNSNDDRMNQVVYADHTLWSGVNTIIQAPGGAPRVGILYFAIRPQIDRNAVKAEIEHAGYIAVNGENVLFPSIGVNADGKAIMSFTLVGSDYFPTAAYTSVYADRDSSDKVHIAGDGQLPEDGFSGYAAFGSPTPGVARWGDYSAAVADENGNIWLAAEYIPNSPRTSLANWGTFISRVNPGN